MNIWQTSPGEAENVKVMHDEMDDTKQNDFSHLYVGRNYMTREKGPCVVYCLLVYVTLSILD